MNNYITSIKAKQIYLTIIKSCCLYLLVIVTVLLLLSGGSNIPETIKTAFLLTLQTLIMLLCLLINPIKNQEIRYKPTKWICTAFVFVIFLNHGINYFYPYKTMASFLTAALYILYYGAILLIFYFFFSEVEEYYDALL